MQDVGGGKSTQKGNDKEEERRETDLAGERVAGRITGSCCSVARGTVVNAMPGQRGCK
jgi:hypothetical protein